MQKAEFFALIKEAVQEAILSNNKDLHIKSNNTDNKKEYSTIKEVAEYFKVSRQTVHTSWIKKGTVKKYKIGGRTLLKITDIEKTMIDLPHMFGNGRDYSYKNPKSFTVENKDKTYSN